MVRDLLCTDSHTPGVFMRIIVAGLGRPGTQSIVTALKQLGLSVASQETIVADLDLMEAAYASVRDGVPFDWSRLDGFDATAGWPGCFLVEQQLAAFPEAPVLLNTRDAEGWVHSIDSAFTVLRPLRRLRFPRKLNMVDHTMSALEARMGGPFEPELWRAGYEAHIAEVASCVPPEHLTAYELSEGWEPICRLLGTDIPERPFPRGNSSKDGGFAKTVRKLLLS